MKYLVIIIGIIAIGYISYDTGKRHGIKEEKNKSVSWEYFKDYKKGCKYYFDELQRLRDSITPPKNY